MTLKERMTKLREKDPMMTVAILAEITRYGDRQWREEDFLQHASAILDVPQEQVDEAVAYTQESDIYARMIGKIPALGEDYTHTASVHAGVFDRVDDAGFFTGVDESDRTIGDMTGVKLPADTTIRTIAAGAVSVLDHGYVRFVEGWGRGDAGRFASQDDYEPGIVEAARQSTQGSFRGWDKGDAKLLTTLFTSKPMHSSPFEFSGMTIEVQAPIMVFREWQRHRTLGYNEMSARYAPLPDLYYNPPADLVVERAIRAQETKNKQEGAATGAVLDTDKIRTWMEDDLAIERLLENHYQDGLKIGVPKELARKRMPVDHYSRMRATGNLTNWLRFLRLRMHPGAMWEIREYAHAVAAIVAVTFPNTWALFERESDK